MRTFEPIQLGSIELFCKAAELGSFSAAAESLGVTPASVSRSIKRLEERLGVRLFSRTTRNVRLTAEGDYVVAEVRGDVRTKRGDRYNNEYCFVFRFRDGKIAEVVEYCDMDLEERVLGPYEAAKAMVTPT